MFKLRTTKQFEKDFKLCKKRGKRLNLLQAVVTELENKGQVSAKYKPHKLTGNYKDFWECHIQPDWLLIWLINESDNEIILTRTGTHSDLF
jgi:mRNA interferase YafQ